ncbi:hypothetical protein CMALT394_250003 [Carnobacterium maltaromaticum]|nr:hypothetical protein CMALT394_250003 [Carnobacterium maltaromaticum]
MIFFTNIECKRLNYKKRAIFNLLLKNKLELNSQSDQKKLNSLLYKRI